MWSGLLAAKELLGAEVIVVADGPGNLGTETTWGVSALASGHALMAAATLDGRPIPALRVSFADERERHRGVSHHSLTILADVCKVDVHVPVPALDGRGAADGGLGRAPLAAARGDATISSRWTASPPSTSSGPAASTSASMGRGIDDDPAFFLAAGAAGVLAGRMAAENRPLARGAAVIRPVGGAVTCGRSAAPPARRRT